MLFAVLPLVGGSLVAQEFSSKPDAKPFQLTRYDKRIPADSWMLASMDLDVFFSSKALMKAVFENSDGPDAPPKVLVDLFTSGKMKMVMPYPIIFGLGGDADKPGNSPENNPIVMDFLKQRHQMGLYFNLSQMPDAVVSAIYQQEASKGNLPLTEAEALELFRFVKQTLPPSHFGMNFKKGEFNLAGAVHDKGMAEKWPGKGLPKSLLNAIPASSMVVLGGSLNVEEANEDIQARLGQFLKIANLMQKIESPNEQPSLDLEAMSAQINAMTREMVGMDAKDLLQIFHGDFVMGVGIGFEKTAGGDIPEPQVVVGATVKEEGKLTLLLDALEANGAFADPMFNVVRRPGHLFICTTNLARQLKRGDLAKPIRGDARKALQDNHLAMFADMQKIMKAQARAGLDFLGRDDPEYTAMFEKLDSMILAARFEEGKMNSKLALQLRDPSFDALEFILQLGALDQLDHDSLD